VQQHASAGCPPELIDLIMECVAAKPEDRPAMPEVIKKLRKMEVDILSRMTIGQGEHVGSIKIVKGRKGANARGGKALSALFAGRDETVAEEKEEFHNAKETQNDEFEYDTEEEEVLKMMQASSKIKFGEHATTWRTARWDEPQAEKPTLMSLFSNPPGKLYSVS
jgi:hypothetical protein